MIIGLTGKNASGKGEVAAYLKTRGFVYFSLSDELREESGKRGLGHSRNNLIKLGNDLRKEFGPAYLAKKISEKIENNKKKKIVVDSIRSPYEAKELMKNKDFILIGVDAPIELRFKRLLERNRAGDAKTLKEFKEQEQRENLKSGTNQQLNATLELSKKFIINDGTLEQLHKEIDGLLLQLKEQ